MPPAPFLLDRVSGPALTGESREKCRADSTSWPVNRDRPFGGGSLMRQINTAAVLGARVHIRNEHPRRRGVRCRGGAALTAVVGLVAAMATTTSVGADAA